MTDRRPSDRYRDLPPPTQDLVQGFIPMELLIRDHVNFTPPRPPRQRRQWVDPFR